MKEIKISDIKPVGNFDETLEKLNIWMVKLEDEKKYTHYVADFIKIVVNELGLVEVLSDFDEPYTGWDYEEQKMCLLYTHILLIRANNIAQKYLNNIEMDPINIQLMNFIKTDKKLYKIFGDLTII